MVEKPLIYTQANRISDQELTTLIAVCGEVRTRREESVKRVYLDTFDWRLFRAGTVLEVMAGTGGYTVTWRRLRSGVPLVTMTMRRVPVSAADFSAPRLRTQMQDILGSRTLESRISLKSRELDCSILDKAGKVLSRLERRAERAYVDRSMDQVLLPDHIYLVPYRGYEKQFDKLHRRIANKAKLVPAEVDPVELVLNRLGIDPEDYNNRPSFQLDAGQPALAALRQVLTAFLRIMKQNVEGACQGDDPEFLHDFLVAERRTRCMLNQYPGVLPSVGSNQITQDLEWAESVATPVRDLDIYLDLVDEFLGKVDSAHRRALKPLFHYLNGQKQKEQRQMRIALESPRFKRVLSRWEECLKAGLTDQVHPENAVVPISEMVCRCINALSTDLLVQGKKAVEESSDGGLCELHQSSKKLGYQLEIFQSVFPEAELKPLMKEHDRLQSSLNRFRDLHTQHRALGGYRDKMRLEQQAVPVSLEAIDLLLERLGAERDAERRRVHKRFAKFSRKKNRERFSSIFPEKAPRGSDAQ